MKKIIENLDNVQHVLSNIKKVDIETKNIIIKRLKDSVDRLNAIFEDRNIKGRDSKLKSGEIPSKKEFTRTLEALRSLKETGALSDRLKGQLQAYESMEVLINDKN